jgi:2-keto-4-pentenoate hydratase/2-oxohepta-3-ene-1,7-dioic acid hydratase in catechol pathway
MPSGSTLDAVHIGTYRNGECIAEADVAAMRFAPAALLAFLSRLMPLEAGDIISTGTPGAAVVTLGDVVECRISGLQPLIVHVSGRASSDRPPGAAGLAQDT